MQKDGPRGSGHRTKVLLETPIAFTLLAKNILLKLAGLSRSRLVTSITQGRMVRLPNRI